MLAGRGFDVASIATAMHKLMLNNARQMAKARPASTSTALQVLASLVRIPLTPFGLNRLDGKRGVMRFYLPLPLRRQKLPDDAQPHGQVPFGGFGIASWAPCVGTQNDPDVT